VLLAHPPHHHAQVLRLEDDGDAFRLEHLHERVSDLLRQVFLRLQAARIDIDDARDLREADDVLAGEVGDVRTAEEGEEMMLAEAVELDVSDDDEVGIHRRAKRAVDNSFKAFLVSRCEEMQCLFEALGSFLEALAVRIFAN